MKRIVSIIIALCLVLGSFSFAFATATSWDTSDSQHLTGIYNSLVSSTSNGVLKALLQIESDLATYMPLKSDVKTISTTLGQIWSALSFAIDGQYISVFVARIMTAVEGLNVDLTTIVSRLTSINTQTTNTAANTAGIYSLINGYDDYLVTNVPYIADLRKALTNTRIAQSGFDLNYWRTYLHQQMISTAASGDYTLRYVNGAGGEGSQTVYAGLGTPLGNIALILRSLTNSFADNSYYRWHADLDNFNNAQTFTNWNGSTLTTSTFTPVSAVDGIYKWFSDIQTPIARLAFVHASDEEIEARQLAADNQAAVVDNFVNPSGSGSLDTSGISDIAGISSGVKSNFNTGVSASGVFDLFTGNHTSDWFSQETANELNGVSSSRTLKTENNYDTPLLDSQMNEIMQLFEKDKKQ